LANHIHASYLKHHLSEKIKLRQKQKKELEEKAKLESERKRKQLEELKRLREEQEKQNIIKNFVSTNSRNKPFQSIILCNF
jgi:hypothetical protein